MTDFDPDHRDPDDEIASAYLDDEVSAAERVRVENDPDLLARVEAMAAAREALRSAPVSPPTPAARDHAIAVAVGRSPVVALASARARRRARVASIAAAIVLAAAIAGLLVRLADSSSHEQFSTAAGQVSTTSTPAATGQGALAPTETAPFAEAARALGSFTDRGALVDAARSALAGAQANKSASSRNADTAAPAPSCTIVPPARTVAVDVLGSAVFQGQAVRLDVYTRDDGSQLLVVSDASSCAEVFSQAL